MASDFIATLEVQGYSAKTLEYYGRYLTGFVEHVEAEGKDIFEKDRTSPACVDYGCLLRLLQKLRLTGIKEATLRANKSALSTWYKWLIRLGKVDRNPIEMLPAIKCEEVDPKPLPVEDTLKILDGFRVMKWKHQERNRAILEMFYASGVRLNELHHVDVTDLVLNDARPHVIIRYGKGKKQGVGRLTPPAVQAIREYMPKRAAMLRKWEKPSNWEPLFLSHIGANRLCADQIYTIVVETGEKILGRPIHPHQFRHSFCTDLLNNGADLESIRKLARHEQLTTTQKYLNVSTAHLDEAYSKLPRNK